MSRIGKKIIQIPNGVTVLVEHGVVSVRGPKGELTRILHPLVSVFVEDNTVRVDVVQKEDKKERSLWGAFASHIINMIQGVTKGFTKQLEISGVGYKMSMQGKDVKFDIGFSHPVIYAMPAEVTASVEKNVITLASANKEQLGQVAAEIRAIKKPEPYKGKGIKYADEQIRRKAGKTAKS